MSKRPRIKQADGSLLDLPLDAETIQGKGLNDLALKYDVTDAIDNFKADEFEPAINNLRDDIPTKTSQLTNDNNYATTNQLFSKNYNDLTNKPTIPTKTSQLTNNSGFAVTTMSQTFTQENTFTHATYAPTWVDIASSIGKSSKFTRGAFMQLVTGQILLPNASCNDTQAGVTGGFNTEANKLKFQTMTASSGQPVVTTVAEINSNGIYQNGKKVANITDIPTRANNGYSGYLHAGSDGVAEMGKYIDFHATSTDTKDYDVRFVCPSLNSQVDVHLPSKAGTIALTSDISSSSGGVETGDIHIYDDGRSYSLDVSRFSYVEISMIYNDCPGKDIEYMGYFYTMHEDSMIDFRISVTDNTFISIKDGTNFVGGSLNGNYFTMQLRGYSDSSHVAFVYRGYK